MSTTRAAISVDALARFAPEQLERALARLMADHVKATGTVDPAIMQDLVATLAEFGIRLPGDLVVLSRALVTVDGTLRVLAPDLSLVAFATESMTSTATAAPVLDRDELIRAACSRYALATPARPPIASSRSRRGDLGSSVVDEDARHPSNPHEPSAPPRRGHTFSSSRSCSSRPTGPEGRWRRAAEVFGYFHFGRRGLQFRAVRSSRTGWHHVSRRPAAAPGAGVASAPTEMPGVAVPDGGRLVSVTSYPGDVRLVVWVLVAVLLAVFVEVASRTSSGLSAASATREQDLAAIRVAMRSPGAGDRTGRCGGRVSCRRFRGSAW